jgi:lipoyl(octanoyl) transferase
VPLASGLTGFPPLPPGEGWGEGITGAKHDVLVSYPLTPRDYTEAWRAMQSFTQQRGDGTPDELWLVEHPPVFTQGLNGKPEHLLSPGDIPVVQTDRGGQVTYHGPGQVVAYTLIDLSRRRLGVRDLVDAIEHSVIALLAEFGIESHARRDAPGVYVGGAKLASLGLRVRRGKSYHGVSINVAMDLEPFNRINPCGYPDITVTDLATLGHRVTPDDVAARFVRHFAARLGYNNVQLAETIFFP